MVIILLPVYLTVTMKLFSIFLTKKKRCCILSEFYYKIKLQESIQNGTSAVPMAIIFIQFPRMSVAEVENRKSCTYPEQGTVFLWKPRHLLLFHSLPYFHALSSSHNIPGFKRVIVSAMSIECEISFQKFKTE